MKKLLKILLVVIPLVIIAGVVILVLSLGGIIKAGVQTVGSKATGGNVVLDDVGLSLFSGKSELNGFSVGNPEGFKTPHAFKVDTIRVVLQPSSLMSDTIVIKEIFIDAPEITYEAGVPSSNIGQIRKNVNAFAGVSDDDEPEPEPEPEAEEEAGPGKKLIIEKFVLQNAKVNLSATLMGGKKLSLPMADIELTDIGKDSDKQSAKDVINEIYAAISKAVLETVAKSGDAIKAGADALKDQAGALEDAGKKAGEAVKDQADALKDKLGGVKNLFGGEKE